MWSLIWLQSPASCFFFTIDEEIEDLEVPELEEEIPGPEEDLAVVEPGAHRFPDQVVVGEGQRPPSP